ncbi:PREDICTED: protein AATF [Eufriesea mexicana]|nr:PREDICTED: protein AATF [Eufriesea mexicana]
MALKTKKNSLADKINSLISTRPTVFNSDDETEDTKAKVVEHYNESDNSDNNFQVSQIRRQNLDSLDQVDERYKGKKISRKNIYNNDNEDFDLQNISDSENEEMDSMEEQTDDDINDSNNETEIENDDSNTEDDERDNNVNDDDIYDSEIDVEQHSKDEEDISDTENENIDTSFTKQEKDIQTISQTNVRTDIEKGNCVRNQLKLWESLLEVRIKLQKCLITSNQLPQYNVYKDFKTNTEYMKTANEMTNKLKTLLNNMLQLESFLLKQYPETKSLPALKKKRKAEESTDKIANAEDSIDEEIPSSTEDENTEDIDKNVSKKKLKLYNYEKILNDNHKSYIEYRNSVIQKWNEKTRIASGKLNKGMNESMLNQIEFALNDKEKLYKRSRLKRSEYKIIGKTEAADDNDGRRIQEYDSEIYDDDDFYHQLLRDLIEYKSAGITDPIQLSKQWIQLQNMRHKMKRKIDTRATKGRRIRYNVHNKLINFMAPITINDIWMDHAKDELYNSLFGKIK